MNKTTGRLGDAGEGFCFAGGTARFGVVVTGTRRRSSTSFGGQKNGWVGGKNRVDVLVTVIRAARRQLVAAGGKCRPATTQQARLSIDRGQGGQKR